MGVFAPLVGIVGTLQAMEAIKLLAAVGDLQERLGHRAEAVYVASKMGAL